MVYSYLYFPQHFSIGKNISTKVADGMAVKPHLTDTSAIRQDITDEYKYKDGSYITLFSSVGYLVICVYRHVQQRDLTEEESLASYNELTSEAFGY